MRISEYLENKKFSGKVLAGGTMKNGSPVAIFALIESGNCNGFFKLSDDALSVECLEAGKVFDASFKSGNKRIYSSSDIGSKVKDELDSGKSLIEALDAINDSGMVLVFDGDKYSIGVVNVKDCETVDRTVWNYPITPGFGHIAIESNYSCPAFESDPAVVRFEESLSEVGTKLWASLRDEKVSLFIGSENGGRIFNKNIW